MILLRIVHVHVHFIATGELSQLNIWYDIWYDMIYDIYAVIKLTHNFK